MRIVLAALVLALIATAAFATEDRSWHLGTHNPPSYGPDGRRIMGTVTVQQANLTKSECEDLRAASQTPMECF